MRNVLAKIEKKERRRKSIKRKLAHSNLPKLLVFRSNLHIYAQIISPVDGKVMMSYSSKRGDFGSVGSNVKGAELVGEGIGKIAKDGGVEQVCFDRNGYAYHGRVKALAEGARKYLKF